jgi:hypothetical protein
MMSSTEQERILLAVKSKAPPIREREMKIHANFHLNMKYGKYT